MVAGDKPPEDFVLITILAKRDAIEYVVPMVGLVILFLSQTSSILAQSCSTIS